MRRYFLILMILSFADCFSQSKINSLQELKIINSDNYSLVKQKIRQEKVVLKTSDSLLGEVFKKSLVNKIIPFWEGTKWTFEGHTTTPKKGTIACGYFVSTTLKHIGLNINRYKLAQQLPINEAKSLAINSEVKIISEASVSENISAIDKSTKDGIYFIGFDQSHVGYLLKEKGNLYLIHSNYYNSEGVMIEQIEKSQVFSDYRLFYLVPLSNNKELLEYWIGQKPIKVITK